MKASIIFFDTLHKRELRGSINYEKDPQIAVKKEISSHKEEIRNFCKAGDCSFALLDEETEKILYTGCVQCDRYSGLLNIQQKIIS